ncbi:hypothetical protein [Colwellia psychrerythraea]|uniref:PEP motif anchor domain protein n=1 Tax=Colwellia psychrerythraea TaxID=28229 RepID=A0A099KHX5_COLPS|nr:hypothetical protein [Colwellia psychrerythraea]KGJ89193.1 hypothetical protein GAB14E_4189 [Colwellia psychrerythraea]
MKYIIQLMLLVIMLSISSPVKATAMCSPNDVKLDFVQLADLSDDPIISPAPDPEDYFFIPATNCVLLLGNDQPLPTGHNIGEYQDGLLNGQVWLPSPDSRLSEFNTLFDPFYDSEGPLAQDGSDGYNNILFINSETDLQDLDDTDGNTNKTDPGWVFLGKDDADANKDGEGDGFQYSDTGVGIVNNLIEDPEDENYDNLTGIAIENLLNINFTCIDEGGSFDLGDTVTEGDDIGDERSCTQGSWSLMPDVDIVDKLDELFGEGVFDHLAIIFKTGNVCHPASVEGEEVKGKKDCIDEFSGPQFSIYDFNFADIFNSFPGGDAEEALQSPYNLGGRFDLFNTFHGHGISHISVLARDPASIITEMPEPKSTMLTLFALGLFVLRYKSTHVSNKV